MCLFFLCIGPGYSGGHLIDVSKYSTTFFYPSADSLLTAYKLATADYKCTSNFPTSNTYGHCSHVFLNASACNASYHELPRDLLCTSTAMIKLCGGLAGLASYKSALYKHSII